ncbi:MAG TPA: haloalkane dehalogenase, partial [Phenylobacterium sp.]|nr:haloalkane dehalogenase [Phenylobacterium sp.]
MNVLRTPDARFANLPGFHYAPNYLDIHDADGTALRIHYVDEGPKSAPPILLMHGNPT